MKIFTFLFDSLCSYSFSNVAQKNSSVEKNTNASVNKKKQLLLMPLMVLTILLANANAWGQTTGIYESYAILNTNGGGNTYYDLNAATPNADFNNANLGTFLSGTNTLVFAGGENKTFKCSGGNVTGSNIYYRVYLSSGSGGSFTGLGMGFVSNDAGGCGGNQTWRINNNSTNIITGLTAGTYTLEIYSDAPGSPSTAFASNGGANYKATFTVVTQLYSKSTGNLETLSNWGTNTDGTGTAPANFSTAGITYNIRNNAAPTIGASWTVSGAGSKIIVGNGTNACNFTIPAALVVTSPNTDISNNGTITRTSSAAQSFGTLNVLAGGTYDHNFATGSLPTATWNATSTLFVSATLQDNNFSGVTFGNVTFRNAAGTTMFTSTSANGVSTISGNLTLEGTGTVVVSNQASFGATLSISGNLVISGNSILRIENVGTASGSLTKTIVVNGNYSQSNGTMDLATNTSTTITFPTNPRLSILEVKGNFTHTGGTITETATDLDMITRILLSGTTGSQTLESTGQTNSVNFNVAGSNAQCVVAASKTFILGAGGMTVSAGTATPDLSVNGTLRNSGGVITTTGTATFNSTGTYEHNFNGTTTSGIIPTSTWDAGSTCKIINFGSSSTFTGPLTSANGWGQTFSNFEWAVSNQTGTINWQMNGTTPPTINGNFIISNTNAQLFRLSSSGTYTLTIGGDLQLTSTAGSSTLNISNGGSATINIGGNFLQSQSANTQLLSASGVGTKTINFNKSSGSQTFTQSAGTISGSINWNVGTGTSTNTLQLGSNVNLGTGTGTFTVLGNATFNAGTNVLSGSASSTINSGGSLITANTGGVNGSITLSGTPTYNAAANYIFNGSSAQVTGAALTAANNITLNNSAGLTLSANTAVSGTLTLTNGKITTNTKTLTLTNAVAGASSSNYIVADATGTATFNGITTARLLPIGTDTSYAPITVAAGSSTNYSTYVTSTLPCSPTDATKVVNLAWGLNGSNAPSSVIFQWNASNQAASFAPASSCDLGRYSTACPYTITNIGAPAGSGPYTLTASSGFASGNQTYVLGNDNAVYLAPPTIATTITPTSITHNAASSGGQTLTGGSITAKGVVWNTSSAPTVALSTKTNDGTGTADFSSTLNSLSTETLYFVRAYATNASATAYGDEKSFRTLSSPATVQATGLSATASSSSTIDLSWTGATFPGSGATASGYVLLRAISPNTPSLGNSNGSAPTAGSNTTIVSSTLANNATSFSNSGLASATTYNYLLIPYTWDGTNASSYNYLTTSAPTANDTTQSGATPPVLTSSAATAITSTGATLNGNITSDGGGSVTARGFVYSSSDNTPILGESGVTDQASGTGTGTFNASISSLTPNTTYFFQAYATNSSGTSYGGILSFTTPKAEPTAQPTSLVFSSVTTTSFTTAFTAASGSPDGYIVVRSTSASLSADPVDGTTYTAGNSFGGGTIVNVGSTISGISNSGLTAGTTYYTFVFAYNNSGSNIDYLTASPLTSSTITITGVPATPTFSSITTTGFTVDWTATSGASTYRLDVSTASNFASFVSGYQDLTVNTNSQAVTGLAANTLYFVRVRAVNASGTSANSTSASSATLSNAPTVGTATSITASGITANWTAPSSQGAVSFTYTLELSTANDFSTITSTVSNIASGTTTNAFSSLSEGTTYYYRIKVINSAGSSAWSSVSAGATTLTTSISLTDLGTTVTENFDAMSSSTSLPSGWRIHASTTTPSWSSASASVTQQAFSGAPTAGGTYNWGTSASERAVGAMTSGGFASPNQLLVFTKNNTGSTITNFSIAYTAERYRINTAAASVKFYYSTNGTSWTEVTDGQITSSSFPTGASSYTFSSPLEIERTFIISGLTIASAADFYLRWDINTTGGNSQGIGIDDVSIKPCGTISAPTASNQTFCSAENATVASLAATGSNIQWYAANTGGSALSSSTAIVNNTIYYASQTETGCESFSRTAVTVTITNTPSAPTATATQVFCTSDLPTVANLTATGSSIQWYAASTGGSPLSTSTALVNNTIYYATQTVSGCESTTRFAVTATLVINGTWLGNTSTDWNTATNWCGGVPTSATNVVINSGASNYPDLSTGADGVANSITINSGGSFIMGGSEILTITAGGSFTNNGTFTAGASTRVVFAGTGSITGTVAFNNVTASGTLTPSIATTINGVLIINNGGSIATNSPIFGASSTLQYNYGGGFGARRNQALEWPSTNGPANLILTNGSWIQLTGNRNLSGNATITNGALQASGARTLTMNGTSQTITVSTASGGAIYGTDNGFGNDLSLVIASGSTTTLTGDATTSSDDEKKFVAVTVNAGGTLALSRGILCKYGAFTVNGTLQINANGYLQTSGAITPSYGGTALLRYNSGSSYGRGLEWSATTGLGYPNNVQISNNTTLDLGANGGTGIARQCAGSLTVDSGSTLTLNANVMSQALTVKGDYINNGTTILSGTSGGDLKLEGNMNDNGIFNANGRAIFFEGGNNQTINSSSNPLDIDVVRIGKSGGEVILAQNLLVDETADPIRFTTATSVLNLNGFTATFGKAGTASAITMNASSRIKGSTTSSLEILGTGAFGTIYFDQTTLGTTNALNNFIINRTSSGSVTLANPVAVSSTLTITNGILNLGTNIHTAGALTLGNTAQTSGSSYGGTSSPAENINTTYFATTTGYVNVGTCSAISLTSTTLSSSACTSGASFTLANTTASNLPVGNYTVFYTLSGSNTGSFTTTMTVASAGSGTFTTGSLSAGSTTLTVNYLRNGCVSMIASGNTATFTVNNASTAAVLSGTTSICSGSSTNLSVAITGGVSPYTVVYSAGTINSYVSGAAISVSPTSTTTYTITSVTDANGCAGTGNSGSAVVTIDTTTSTDGGVTWSNGSPTASKSVVFDGSTGTVSANLSGCSLRLINNASVTVASGFTVTLDGRLLVDSGSTFTLNNNANLLQNTTLANSGNIVVKRNSSALKRLDYTLWSSPVTGQGLYAFSPLTSVVPNIRFYKYLTNTNVYNNSLGFGLTNLDVNNVNGTDSNNVQFASAKGYLIRMPWNHPTAATIWNGTFTGVPNNGNISYTMDNFGVGQRFNLVGNPYPSPISITQFVSDNSTNITGTLYFWRKSNNTTNNAYCSWSPGGPNGTFVSNNEDQVVNPNGIIRSGQGFFVEALNNATTLNFNNGQRSSNTSNQFFRVNNTLDNDVETNRFWLNLTNTSGGFAQMAAGYMFDATDGVDRYDGKNINTGDVLLNSILDNTDYTIQGKALPFNPTDVIPLSYKITTAGTYTIAIDHVDGLFTGGAQAIYLKDTLTATEHNLQSGAYTFASDAGSFTNRFEIIFQSQLGIGNPTFTDNNVIIYTQNNDLVVNTGTIVMTSIKVFDIQGRLLQEKKGINASQTIMGSGLANQVLLVQITSEDGVMVTKKVIR